MSKQSNIKIIALAFVMIFSFIQDAEAVMLKQRSTIDDDYLRLGHVFDGVTENADYVLAPAPIPGETTVLNAYSLNRIASAFGLEWKASNAYQQSVIERSATIVEPAIIQEEIAAYLQKNNASLGKFNVELSNKNQRIVLPSSYAPMVDVISVDYDARRDRFQAVVATQDGRNIDVAGRIAKLTTVPVLSRTISSGDIIQDRDISWLEVDSSQVTPNLIVDKKQLVGRTPRRSLSEMSLVRANDIETPLSVAKGDTVDVQLITDKIQLAIKARALSDGAVGDTVRVLNVSSNRVIDAIVTGPQKVEVRTAVTAGL